MTSTIPAGGHGKPGATSTGPAGSAETPPETPPGLAARGRGRPERPTAPQQPRAARRSSVLREQAGRRGPPAHRRARGLRASWGPCCIPRTRCTPIWRTPTPPPASRDTRWARTAWALPARPPDVRWTDLLDRRPRGRSPRHGFRHAVGSDGRIRRPGRRGDDARGGCAALHPRPLPVHADRHHHHADGADAGPHHRRLRLAEPRPHDPRRLDRAALAGLHRRHAWDGEEAR